HFQDIKDNKAWAAEREITWPILMDKDGKVGKAFGAKTTPHMFVVDGEGMIRYQGAIDNDPHGENTLSGESEKTENYVKLALDQILAGKPVSTTSVQSYGCSVKYAS